MGSGWSSIPAQHLWWGQPALPHRVALNDHHYKKGWCEPLQGEIIWVILPGCGRWRHHLCTGKRSQDTTEQLSPTPGHIQCIHSLSCLLLTSVTSVSASEFCVPRFILSTPPVTPLPSHHTGQHNCLCSHPYSQCCQNKQIPQLLLAGWFFFWHILSSEWVLSQLYLHARGWSRERSGGETKHSIPSKQSQQSPSGKELRRVVQQHNICQAKSEDVSAQILGSDLSTAFS